MRLLLFSTCSCASEPAALVGGSTAAIPTGTLTTAFPLDLDGDGYAIPLDCNDNNASIHPGAIEIVGDGIDQNCDGREICYRDDDDDGARTTATLVSGDADCRDAGEGVPTDPIDCNDANAAIHPAAAELAGDNVDQNCDLRELCFTDADNDGARLTTVFTSGNATCNDANEGLASDPLDCDDSDAKTRPGAAEVVGDGRDQDCNSQELCYVDGDNDGARLTTTVVSLDLDCTDASEGLASDPIDCNDANGSIHPAAAETVADGVDQDCNGQELCYDDADDDGARATTTIASSDLDCADAYEAVGTDPVDCNDGNAAIRPGVAEVRCDGVDNDCSSATPDAQDADADGFNECLDCDDSDNAVFPGQVEVTADAIDQDCDGFEQCQADTDNDGFGEDGFVASADLDCTDNGEAAAPDDTCIGFDDAVDPDGDGVATGCDACPIDAPNDTDGDGACDSDDTCPGFDDALDTDGDGVPNGCDACSTADDADGDGVPDDCDACPGSDDALDADGDHVPDGCDPCPLDAPNDTDGDGVCDGVDACPGADDTVDADGDGQPDDCDPCPLDNPDDSDNDGVCEGDDRCPGADDSVDEDGDGIPAGCDDCDAPEGCDPSDRDGDGIADDVDPDPDNNGGNGTGAPPDTKKGVGCASAPAGGVPPALVLVALFARWRRNGESSRR